MAEIKTVMFRVERVYALLGDKGQIEMLFDTPAARDAWADLTKFNTASTRVDAELDLYKLAEPE